MKIICDVYKSPTEEEAYIYVKKEDGLKDVPEALLEKFGKPKHVMTMLLTPDKKLGRAEASRVIEQIETAGFYFQMPPPKSPDVMKINAQNTKINLI